MEILQNKQKKNFLNIFFCSSLIVLFFAVIFSAPCIIFNRIFLNYFSKSAIIQEGFLILFCLFLFFKLIKKDYITHKHPLFMPLLLIFIWSSISIFYAVDKYKSFIALSDFAFAFFFFWLTFNIAKSKSAKEYILVFIFIAGFLTSLLGIFQHLLNLNFISQIISPAATFSNKNLAVHFIILSIPIGLIFFIKTKSRFSTWFISLLLAIMITYLIYTKTRAGWVAFAFQMALLILLLKKIKEKTFNIEKFFALLIIISIVIFMVKIDKKSGYKERAETMVDINRGTIAQRIISWKGAVKLIKNNFLCGVGFGNFETQFPYYNQAYYLEYTKGLKNEQKSIEGLQMREIHNDYLDILSEIGLVGFLLFIFFVIKFLRLTFKNFNRTENSAIFFSMAGLSINALFSFPLQLPVPLFTTMILMGLTNFSYYETKKNSRNKIIFMLFISVVSLCFLHNFYKNNKNYKKTISDIKKYYSKQEWQKVIMASNTAKNYNSYEQEEALYLGVSYMELKKYKKATETFKAFIDKNPNDANMLLNLGNAYLKTGKKKEAITSYEQVVYMKPTFVKAIQNIAKIYIKEKNFKKAKHYLLEAQKIEPKNSQTVSELGLIEVKTNNFKKAIPILIEAIKLDNRNAFAYNTLGVAFYNIGEIKNSLLSFQKATTFAPNDQSFIANFNIVYKEYIKKKK